MGFAYLFGSSENSSGDNLYTFDKILQRYYSGIAIGTWPVYMTSEYFTSPIRQEFVSPSGKADILVKNPEIIEKFEFTINSNKICLDEKQLKQEKIRLPLDKFIKKGINEIVYYPLDENEEKSITVWVEVFKKVD